MVAPAAVLQARLGLSDDELCVVLDADPVAVISGELAHRPELGILLSLTQDPADRVGDGVLRRWVRTAGPAGRPLDQLLARDFPAFERAVEALEQRGFVIGG
ncbi:unannotated protein [freshwater metagenome]|uniref:Unannotated protein n=1 Tax=freshwater metagenome TaxID=449393 RepID=A0A6J7IRR6_9ZZZZ|nr:hypothetical protein [Actinomycetota bacterium]